jgi:2-alkyl-3-oxoalkanoate reductase
MRVLVTGATGFLGREIVAALLRRGHTVRAVHRPATVPDLPADVELVTLDLRSPDGLPEALDGVDVVLHAAATKSGDFHDQFAGTVVPTQHLLAAMRDTGVGRLVLVSSFSVYDDERIPPGAVLDEQAPTVDPATTLDPYSATKALQEHLVEAAAPANGWSVTIARPGAVYGPDNLWTARLGYRRGDDIWICVGGRAKVPLTYVGNCADALAHLTERTAERTTPGIERCNVVDDDPPTQREYLHRLMARVGRPRRFVILPWTVVHLLIRLLTGLNRRLGGPLKLPGALRLDAAMARWRPAEHPNEALRRTGWRQPVSLDAALDAST